ncbi:hypothetical protein CBOM_04160 [Ceraceosorus bombacis]|uniref:Uncharacterized protein n=1 Tax=Ceraceosorus bombacis TaxID=401625 RepID=A0A0N7LAX1_9BASI|nr:hypothetical protein CBOM_04160 [Ceraceosorus bombacis]
MPVTRSLTPTQAHMQGSSKRRPAPTPLDLRAAHAKKVSRGFNKYPVPNHPRSLVPGKQIYCAPTKQPAATVRIVDAIDLNEARRLKNKTVSKSSPRQYESMSPRRQPLRSVRGRPRTPLPIVNGVKQHTVASPAARSVTFPTPKRKSSRISLRLLGGGSSSAKRLVAAAAMEKTPCPWTKGCTDCRSHQQADVPEVPKINSKSYGLASALGSGSVDIVPDSWLELCWGESHDRFPSEAKPGMPTRRQQSMPAMPSHTKVSPPTSRKSTLPAGSQASIPLVASIIKLPLVPSASIIGEAILRHSPEAEQPKQLPLVTESTKTSPKMNVINTPQSALPTPLPAWVADVDAYLASMTPTWAGRTPATARSLKSACASAVSVWSVSSALSAYPNTPAVLASRSPSTVAALLKSYGVPVQLATPIQAQAVPLARPQSAIFSLGGSPLMSAVTDYSVDSDDSAEDHSHQAPTVTVTECAAHTLSAASDGETKIGNAMLQDAPITPSSSEASPPRFMNAKMRTASVSSHGSSRSGSSYRADSIFSSGSSYADSDATNSPRTSIESSSPPAKTSKAALLNGRQITKAASTQVIDTKEIVPPLPTTDAQTVAATVSAKATGATKPIPPPITIAAIKPIAMAEVETNSAASIPAQSSDSVTTEFGGSVRDFMDEDNGLEDQSAFSAVSISSEEWSADFSSAAENFEEVDMGDVFPQIPEPAAVNKHQRLLVEVERLNAVKMDRGRKFGHARSKSSPGAFQVTAPFAFGPSLIEPEVSVARHPGAKPFAASAAGRALELSRLQLSIEQLQMESLSLMNA